VEFSDCLVPFNILCWFQYWCVGFCIERCTSESLGCISDNMCQFRLFVLCFGVCVRSFWGRAQPKQQIMARAHTITINKPINYHVFTSLVRWPKWHREIVLQLNCEF
jgi:hypothetical protein